MINLNYFESAFPGEPQLVNQIVDVTLAEFPEFIEDFKKNIAVHDLNGIKDLAHRGQYTAKVFGVDGLRSKLGQLEALEEQSPEEIASLSSLVIDDMEQMLSELSRHAFAS